MDKEKLIEELIESVNPKNDRERKKLYKALSQVSISDYDGHRNISVPKSLMSVVHEGDWYSASIMRNAEVVETFEQSGKREAHCVRDCYGRYWYYMYHYDTVYDDIHFVFIGVKDVDDALSLYSKIGVQTERYFGLSPKDVLYPHICLNVSDWLDFSTNDLSTTPEEYLKLLLENNDLLT